MANPALACPSAHCRVIGASCYLTPARRSTRLQAGLVIFNPRTSHGALVRPSDARLKPHVHLPRREDSEDSPRTSRCRVFSAQFSYPPLLLLCHQGSNFDRSRARPYERVAMPRRAPRNPSNDDLTQEQLEERQLVAEEKAQLVRLVDECIDRAVVLSNEHAYGACWRAVMLHLLKTRFTSLESVRSAGRHFGRVLERAQEYSPTRADKQALRGLYPVSVSRSTVMGAFRSVTRLTTLSHTLAGGPPREPLHHREPIRTLSIVAVHGWATDLNGQHLTHAQDRFHNRHHGEPTHTPVQIPGHMTPEDVIETIEAYARSCLGRLSSPSAWEAAVGEWARYTRYSASHHEPDLGPKQRAMYVHALFSVLDNLYKEEDQAHAATRHFSSPGVDFLFVRLSLSLPAAFTPMLRSWLICRLGVYLCKSSKKQT